MPESTTNDVRYGQVDRDYGRRLATTPPEDDGPLWMVNLMKYREKAFMAVVFDPERLAAQHEHRETAIADTYTMILRPTLNKLAASIEA